MHAFTGLASLQQVTLATVAPGIAEALVATAIGLFAAIPAVVAYNRFARDIDRVAIKLETFIEEFSNILQRNGGAHSASGTEGGKPCPPQASRGRGRRTINEINMVPFIDVMLVLLIIFMVTAPLITPSLIDLPSVGKANKQPDQVVQIVIDQGRVAGAQELQDKTTKLGLNDMAPPCAGPGYGPERRIGRGHQRRPQRQVRNRGQGHGHAAARRRAARGPVRATGQIARTHERSRRPP
jgi:hypothetical protein